MRDDIELRLRVELVNPPRDFAFCLQRGKGSKGQRLDYVETDGEDIAFDLTVTVREARADREPDFFGPFVQGPAKARFFYVCVGQTVPGAAPNWSGRSKVPLTGIGWRVVKAALERDSVLFARYAASRPDGRPALASVRLMDDGWTAR